MYSRRRRASGIDRRRFAAAEPAGLQLTARGTNSYSDGAKSELSARTRAPAMGLAVGERVPVFT